jgi:hypothetical protein
MVGHNNNSNNIDQRLIPLILMNLSHQEATCQQQLFLQLHLLFNIMGHLHHQFYLQKMT